MTNITVVWLSMQMCMSGTINASGLCADGTKPFEAEMRILDGRTEDLLCKPTHIDLEECHAKWTALVRITRDGDDIFVLRPDGSVLAADGYKPTAAAMEFWRALKLMMEKGR